MTSHTQDLMVAPILQSLQGYEEGKNQLENV